MTEKFTPDWVSPPGDTIADILNERDWTQTELTVLMGESPEYIKSLLNGETAITEETAQKLERILGSTTRFWLTRESQYRERLNHKK